MDNELLTIVNYVKNTSLKGNVEIISDEEFLWDLGGVFLRFLLDKRQTTVLYSRRKNRFFDIGHFHEDNDGVLNLIKDINSENKRVHITSHLLGSDFSVEDKAEKTKKSLLFIRHYYSS